MVMLARQLHVIHRSVVDGGWMKVRGRRLAGSTLGVVGFGNIGQAVARRGTGFRMKVLAHDISVFQRRGPSHTAVTMTSRDELFAASDFIVLCAPLTAETRHVVNAHALALMKRSSYLINVARGGLVDETALVEALGTGTIAGAALDVFEDEPLPPDSPLRAFPQCLLGSHNSSNTHEGVLSASAAAVDNLMRDLVAIEVPVG